MNVIEIPVTAKIDFDMLRKALSTEELLQLITHVANRIGEHNAVNEKNGEPLSHAERRKLIIETEACLSEHGKKFIGELAGCIYGKATNK